MDQQEEVHQQEEDASETGTPVMDDVEQTPVEAAEDVEVAEAVSRTVEAERPARVSPPRRNLGAGRAATGGDQPVSATGLAGSRARRWHQAENPLLTREAMKDWIQASGLVLYQPRAQQMGVPAPSLVEATLGRAAEEVAAGEMDAARTLVAALVAEGAVVPLNLLGVSGAAGSETPDYVCSAAVFSFIFTLRGNKSWKTAPATSGAVKVSPLALAAYELLAAKGAMTAYDLTTELGKEVTGAAVLRALTELWGQLRVLPVQQADGAATTWELASARFTRQIKAGANAGQPTALSALISLYLGQALAAEETEVETFLSPLAARSRIREVLHALLGARQLETLVVDGKTLLHVTGEAPGFAAQAVAAEGAEPDAPAAEDGSRIRKFEGKPAGKLGAGKLGTGKRARPAGARPGFGKAAGARPPYERAAGGDRERRPFQKPAPGGRFDKPWAERPSRPAAEFNAGGEAGAAPRKTFSKPGTFGRKREDGRPASGGRERTGSGFGAGRPERGGSGERSGGSARPAAGGFARPYTPRTEQGEGGERPRPAFGKPAFGKPAFRRPESGGTGAFRPRPRVDEGAAGEGAPARKVYRKFDAPRGAKPFARPGGAKPFGGKPGGARPPFGAGGDRPRPAAGGGFRPDRPSFGGPRPGGERASFDSSRPPYGGPRAGGDRPQRSFDGPRPEGGARPPRREAGGFAARPPRPGGDRPFRSGPPRGASAGSGDRPARPFRPSGPTSGPFAKFAGGKKPFGRAGGGSRPGGTRPSGGAAGRGPARGPRGGEGGFAPSKRKRPEDGE